jgi:hypothetical protein
MAMANTSQEIMMRVLVIISKRCVTAREHTAKTSERSSFWYPLVRVTHIGSLVFFSMFYFSMRIPSCGNQVNPKIIENKKAPAFTGAFVYKHLKTGR